MTYIHVQKLVLDEDGRIKSGSASVMESVYEPNKDGSKKGHSKHVQREKLGKIVWLSEDRRKGVFLSPTRGLVEYCADCDGFEEVQPEDERIQDLGLFPEPERHVCFGDAYLVLGAIHRCGYLRILRGLFSSEEEFQRLLAHIVGKLTKNGSKAPLDVRITNSFASYLLTSVPVQSLRTDTRFFEIMGTDSVKVRFFKSFVDMMKRVHPGFGKACYVDTTPLPNSIENNPFNALSSHGVDSVGVMSRLAFIIDSATGLPIWFEIIPGNRLDFTTLRKEMEDVEETLGIVLESFVLDAGYVCREMVEVFDIEEAVRKGGKTMVARMPAKRGYPFKELYEGSKNLFGNGKYAFAREGHHYFGIRREVTVFDKRIYAYVYLDKNNAAYRFGKWLTSSENREEFESLTDKEKTWRSYKDGFFVLLSNIEEDPDDMLDRYFGRMTIEVSFKTIKEYLELLPLCKWSDVTVKGKILVDVIAHICYSELRSCASKADMSVPEMLGVGQGVACLRKNNGFIVVDQPNRQAKAAYAACGLAVPSNFSLDSYSIELELRCSHTFARIVGSMEMLEPFRFNKNVRTPL